MKYQKRTWSDFLRKLVCASMVALALSVVSVILTSERWYFVPFLVLSIISYTGIDVWYERRWHKRALVRMLIWTKQWGAPCVGAGTITTLTMGLYLDSNSLTALGWSIVVCLGLFYGLVSRKDRLMSKLKSSP